MAATFFGTFTVGGSVPGLSAAFETVGTTLVDFRAAVRLQADKIIDATATLNAQLSRFASLEASLQAQVTAVGDAKIAIRIPAVIDFQAQLDAALSIGAGLSVQLTDPALYVSALLDGMIQVKANIAALVPTVALNLQIDASASIALAFEAKIAAVDLQLEALVTIQLALQAMLTLAADIRATLKLIADAFAAISVALNAALSAALAAVNLFASLAGLLAATGIDCYLYVGPLSGLGAAIDLATPIGAIGGGTTVRVPIVVVDSANTNGVDGVNAVFRVA